MESFDVVVVGGRCAGATLAVYLRRAGMRVCLVDKATFPSETPSTHVIQPRGVEILADLGVLDSVLTYGAATLDRVSLVVDDVRIDGALDDFTCPGLNVRRTILDQALQQAAADSGVDVRTRCRVSGVRASGGRVIGVETVDGPLDAELVVGADGRGSVVAKSVGAREYLAKAPGRVPVWGYFATGAQESRLRVARRGNLAFLASPTDSGLYMAAVCIDHDDAGDFNRDRETNYREAVRSWPELDDIVCGAERDGPLRVMSRWHGYFRESAGPGWVLVGDAGHFKDFSPGQGIADALCQAQALSAAISATSGSTAARDTAMERWWQNRDRGSYDMYWLAMQMGRAGQTSPLITEVLRRIADDPDGPSALLRVLNQDMSSSRLFTAPRLLAATVATLRDHPGRRRETYADIRRALAAEAEKRGARLRSSKRSGLGSA